MKHLAIVGAVLGGLSTALVPALAQNWTATSAPSTNWSCVASSADGSKLVAAVNGGLIYTSTNAGATWSVTSAPTANWSSVATSADGTKMVAANQSALFVSSDSGGNWTEAVGNNFWDISGGYYTAVLSSADGTVLTALFVENAIVISTNAGSAWTLVGPLMEVGAGVTRIACSADGRNLALGVTIVNALPVIALVRLCIDTGTNLAFEGYLGGAPGQCGGLVSSADGTKVSELVNNPSAADCPGVWYSWASGVTSMSNCMSISTWTSVAPSADGTRLAAVASSGAISTSTDAGATWTTASVTNANWSAVTSSADGAKLMAVAAGGGIYTWQTTPAPALNITATSNGFVISWVIPSMSFVLQQNPGLNPTNWTDVATLPVLNLTNLQNQVTLSPPSAPTFYRLKSLAP